MSLHLRPTSQDRAPLRAAHALALALVAGCQPAPEPPPVLPGPPAAAPAPRDDAAYGRLRAGIGELSAYLEGERDPVLLLNAARELEASARGAPDEQAEHSALLLRDISLHLAGEPSRAELEHQLMASFLAPDPQQLERLPLLLEQVNMGTHATPPTDETASVLYAQLTRDMFHYDHPGSPYQDVLPDLEAVTGVTVPAGAVVADVGSGVGSLSILLARRVGEQGRVYAVDVDPEVIAFIEHWRARVPEGRIVRAVASQHEDISLEPDLLDLALINGDGFLFTARAPHPCNPAAKRLLATVLRSLHPGGRLAILSLQNTPDLARCALEVGFVQLVLEPTGGAFGASKEQRSYWLVLARP